MITTSRLPFSKYNRLSLLLNISSFNNIWLSLSLPLSLSPNPRSAPC